MRGRKPLNAPQQRLARHKGVDQVGAVLHQRRPHGRQRLPGTPRLLHREQPTGPLALHVAGQRLQHLAERQIEISGAAVGVASPPQRDQIPVRPGGLPGEFVQQRRLAGTCLACNQCGPSLAGQGPIEQGAQPRQFLLPGDEGRERLSTDRDRGRGRPGDTERRLKLGEGTAADLGVERLRLVLGLAAQLLDQHPATGLIVRQGGGPFPTQRQRGHQLPVRLLPVRLQLELAPRPTRRLLVRSPRNLQGAKLAQRRQNPTPVRLALEQHPLVKGGTVAHRQAVQERTAVEGHRPLQARHVRPAAQVLELGDIQPMVAGRVELQAGAGYKQKGVWHLAIAGWPPVA